MLIIIVIKLYIYIMNTIFLKFKLLCYFYCLLLLLTLPLTWKFPSPLSNTNSFREPTNNLHATQHVHFTFLYICSLNFFFTHSYRMKTFLTYLFDSYMGIKHGTTTRSKFRINGNEEIVHTSHISRIWVSSSDAVKAM